MTYNWLQDLRLGLRQLVRRPGFALAAIASLGLGIGANTVLFGVVNRLLLQEIPGVTGMDRLVELGRSAEGHGFDTFSAPDIDDVRAAVPALDSVFAYRLAPLNVRTSGDPQRALGFVVSESYFDTLGVGAARGRVFTAADAARADAEPVVVISNSAWHRLYGADPNIVGRGVTINGAHFAVAGVVGPEFRGHMAMLAPDFYVPLKANPLIDRGNPELLTQRASRWLLAVGRLAPGATLAQAREQLAALSTRLASAYPATHREVRIQAIALAPLPAEIRELIGLFSAVMFALVGLILLMACVNVAGMLLARGEARGGELALRVALGASRTRIVAQLFTEGLLLALVAGIAGVLLAVWARGLLTVIPIPAPFPVALDLPIDAHVLLFAFGLSGATAVVFALLPAWRISQRDPRAALAPGGATDAVRRTRSRDALVVAQIAASLVLIVAAALFLRSLGRAASVDPGFRTEGVSYAEFDLQPSGYTEARGLDLADTLLERLRQVAGVESVATTGVLPLNLDRLGFGAARNPATPDALMDPNVDTVSPDFFRTLGIEVRGRAFDPSDRQGGQDVAIVNRTLAAKLFGSDEPIGRSLEIGYGKNWRAVRVVGVTGDGKYASLNEDHTPFVYLPHRQWPRLQMHLLLRSSLGAAALERSLRSELAAVDNNLPPPHVHPLSDVTQLSVLPQRIAGYVASALGAVGLLLAATGLYGVLALYVAQRRREIGVRLALGATRAGVVRSVAKRAALLVAIGAGIGLVLAVIGAQALDSLLFGIGPGDAIAFAGALLIVLGLSTVAFAFPARQAASVQPAEALRGE